VLAQPETDTIQAPKDQFSIPAPSPDPKPENPEILFDSNIAVRKFKPKKEKKKQKKLSPLKKKSSERIDSPNSPPTKDLPNTTNPNLMTENSDISILPLKLETYIDQNTTVNQPSGILFDSGVALGGKPITKKKKKKSKKTKENPIRNQGSGVTEFMDNSKDQKDGDSGDGDSDSGVIEVVEPKKKKIRRGSNVAWTAKKKANPKKGG
jgi:hypothetical protein